MPEKKTKFDPVVGRKYLVTDQCFWEQLTDKERLKYNPYDGKRLPHSIQLVCLETGTIVNLASGSIISVHKANQS